MNVDGRPSSRLFACTKAPWPPSDEATAQDLPLGRVEPEVVGDARRVGGAAEGEQATGGPRSRGGAGAAGAGGRCRRGEAGGRSSRARGQAGSCGNSFQAFGERSERARHADARRALGAGEGRGHLFVRKLLDHAELQRPTLSRRKGGQGGDQAAASCARRGRAPRRARGSDRARAPASPAAGALGDRRARARSSGEGGSWRSRRATATPSPRRDPSKRRSESAAWANVSAVSSQAICGETCDPEPGMETLRVTAIELGQRLRVAAGLSDELGVGLHARISGEARKRFSA